MVTVFGQDFSVGGSEVNCCFVNVTLVRAGRYVNSGTIECIVPPNGFAGLIELMLQMSGEDVHWGHLSFMYVDAPVISMIVPSFGPSSGGTTVSVVGIGFMDVPNSS